MSFLFKAPSMPTPPPLEMPKTEDVPSAEDAARKAEEAENMRRRNRNRTGRRSTILTSATGASDELELAKKTLLGG